MSVPQVRLERNIKIHSCKDCPKLFVKNEDLEHHRKWHILEMYLDRPGVREHFEGAYVKLDLISIFSCNVCTSSFTNAFVFRRHLATHQKPKTTKNKNLENTNETNNNDLLKPYKCDECGWRFVAESTLEAHLIIHEAKPHICHCGIGYYKIEDLKGHKRLVHPTKITWTPKTKYSGPKDISMFAIKPDPDMFIDEKPKIKPKLKAQLVIKQKRIKKRIKREGGISSVTCHVCNKTLASVGGLDTHMRVHTGEKPYKCSECGKCFTQCGALNIHMAKHKNLMQFKCSYCDKRFNVLGQAKRHEIIHTNLRPYKCKYENCVKGFSDPSALARHLRIHTDERRYKCEFCPEAFTDYSGYLSHRHRTHYRTKFPCKICGKFLASVGNRNVHMRTQHGSLNTNDSTKYYECDYCGKRFLVKNYLRIHISIMHTEYKHKMKCDFCPKTFKNSVYCDTHMKLSHIKSFAFECDYCGDVFVRKPMLIKHIYTNHVTESNSHECAYCHKKIQGLEKLLEHTSTHFDNKCVKCNGRFLTPTTFQRHNCPKCEKCHSFFRTKKMLERHDRKVHSVKAKNKMNKDITSDNESI